MFLVAVNSDDFSQSVSRPITGSERVFFGRNPQPDMRDGPATILQITWNDRFVSRNHGFVQRDGDDLIVTRLPPIEGRSRPNALYTGTPPPSREIRKEPVRVAPGDSFAIGARGNTLVFWLERISDLPAHIVCFRELVEKQKENFTRSPERQQSYDQVEQLDEYSLRLQLKLLQQELPEQVLSGWTGDEELFARAAAFLENALPGQKGVTAAFLALEPTRESGYELLNPDPLARADFRPSRTLISQLNRERPDPTNIHVWTSREDHRIFTAESLAEGIDWVATVPVSLLDEEAEIYRDSGRRPVYLYVETRQGSETAAAAFIPFLRLICSLVASLLTAREEQRIQDRLSTYFSPSLRRLMRTGDQSRLEPAMVDCTVVFADRRGHSRVLEMAKSDEQILDRLRENQDISESRHALHSVEAAEAIIARLAHLSQYEEEFAQMMSAVRIGIATGRLAVGKTGPAQQWHISVFGSVANLGARLERIAKEFRLPVLNSDETYCRIEGYGDRRFRKLCFIRPIGFEESYPIYELILPRSSGGSGATPGDVKLYEAALEPFARREWDECIQMLEVLPDDDSPSQWLKEKALIFRKDPPPPGWAGEVQSLSK